MSQPLHDRVQQCIEPLLKQQSVVAESSEHSLLSPIERQWTRNSLRETINSLSLWDREIEQGQRTNDPEILNIAQCLLGQLSERIATIGSVLNLDAQRVLLAPEEKKAEAARLEKAFEATRKTIESLQTLPKYISIGDAGEASLQYDIARTRSNQRRLQEYFANCLKNVFVARRRSVDLLIGSQDFLWSSLPRIPGLDNGVEWPDKFDGIIIEEQHKDRATTVLNVFCDAWLEVTPEISDPAKLELLRRMGTIFMILSVMKKRKHIDNFIFYGVDDRSLPFSATILRDIFTETQQADANFFEAEQYRAIPRNWPDSECLVLHNEEPLPLRVIEHYGGGTYSSVARVVDMFTKEVYARKIPTNAAGATEHMGNEIRSLQRLCYDGRDHHIVRFVKTYQRGDEFGVLFTPAATTNLLRLLRRYCDQQDSREKFRPVLLRAFGCLSYTLAYIHNEKETRHRDIKLQNILYHKHPHPSEKEEFIWSDFGLAKSFSKASMSRTLGTVVGTDEYVAPEAADPNSQHGRSADIFSLGCVFLEILSVLLTASLSEEGANSFRRLQPYRHHIQQIHLWIANMIRSEEQRRSPAHSPLGPWVTEKVRIVEEHRREIFHIPLLDRSIDDLLGLDIEQPRSDHSLVPLLVLAGNMVQENAQRRPKIADVVKTMYAMRAKGLHVLCNDCSRKFREDHSALRRILHRRSIGWRQLCP